MRRPACRRRRPGWDARARLSGWVHAKRDHGGLLFIDLRDHYGITQCVFAAGSPAFAAADTVRPESVITVTGSVVMREAGTINPRLPTGEIELRVADLVVQSAAEVLPMQVAGEERFPEDIRLKYRFIDLRREKLHRNMMLRSRRSSPRCAAHDRAGISGIPDADPDRVLPGRGARLPGAVAHASRQVLRPAAGAAAVQAIADGRRASTATSRSRPASATKPRRADRSPGEFYQLDFEMSYVTQEDVFNTIEPVIAGVFEEFADGRSVTKPPFPRIPYDQAMLEFGSDKPDLRNPIRIADVTEHYAGSGFGLFARIAASGGIVRAIPAPGAGSTAAQLLRQAERLGEGRGPGRPRLHHLRRRRPEGPDRTQSGGRPGRGDSHRLRPEAGDAVFFVGGKKDTAPKFAGAVRTRLVRRTRPDRNGRLPLLLGHRLPDVSS